MLTILPVIVTMKVEKYTTSHTQFGAAFSGGNKLSNAHSRLKNRLIISEILGKLLSSNDISRYFMKFTLVIPASNCKENGHQPKFKKTKKKIQK
jgi:hypothetical protein